MKACRDTFIDDDGLSECTPLTHLLNCRDHSAIDDIDVIILNHLDSLHKRHKAQFMKISMCIHNTYNRTFSLNFFRFA